MIRSASLAKDVLNATWLAAAVLWFPVSAAALDPARAITQYNYEYWMPEDGLPQVSVQAVIQDRHGYLWIGTQEGLVRFDGVRFTVFDSRNTPAITNNYITALLLATDETLWAGTFGGGLLKVESGAISHIDKEAGLVSDIVHALAEGPDGELWVGTEKGLNCLHHDAVQTFTVDDGLPHELVQALLVDHAGTLWVGTRGGASPCTSTTCSRRSPATWPAIWSRCSTRRRTGPSGSAPRTWACTGSSTAR